MTMKRTLHIGERVYVEDENEQDLSGFGTILLINGEEKDCTIEEDEEFDTIITLELDEHFGECEEEAINVFQLK